MVCSTLQSSCLGVRTTPCKALCDLTPGYLSIPSPVTLFLCQANSKRLAFLQFLNHNSHVEHLQGFSFFYLCKILLPDIGAIHSLRTECLCSNVSLPKRSPLNTLSKTVFLSLSIPLPYFVFLFIILCTRN